MGRMSREKGKRGERELAKILRQYGYACRRGVQYAGGPDSPDVTGLPGIHIECKRTERFSLYDALAQAKKETGKKELPAVFHRKNESPWVVVMDLDDWLMLYREWEAGKSLVGVVVDDLSKL